MTHPNPSSIVLSKPSDFVLAEFEQDPLKNALRNVNAVWLYHTPALVQALPADDYGTNETQAATYLIPVVPSQDVIPYYFSMAFDASITVTRTYYASSDTALAGASYSSLGSVTGSTGADGVVLDGGYTIPAATTHLKIVISTAATMFPQALLIYPAPPSVRNSKQPSGFVPYEDGILESATGAPIHTEFLDRCRKSVLAVWHDRKQNCLSLVLNSSPDEDAGQAHQCQVGSAQNYQLPASIIRLPGYGDSTRFLAKAIAVPNGSTVSGAIVVTLTGQDSASISLDASGSVVSGTASVTPMGDGLEKHVKVTITVAGKSTSDFVLHSLMIWTEQA